MNSNYRMKADDPFSYSVRKPNKVMGLIRKFLFSGWSILAAALLSGGTVGLGIFLLKQFDKYQRVLRDKRTTDYVNSKRNSDDKKRMILLKGLYNEMKDYTDQDVEPPITLKKDFYELMAEEAAFAEDVLKEIDRSIEGSSRSFRPFKSSQAAQMMQLKSFQLFEYPIFSSDLNAQTQCIKDIENQAKRNKLSLVFYEDVRTLTALAANLHRIISRLSRDPLFVSFTTAEDANRHRDMSRYCEELHQCYYQNRPLDVNSLKEIRRLIAAEDIFLHQMINHIDHVCNQYAKNLNTVRFTH